MVGPLGEAVRVSSRSRPLEMTSGTRHTCKVSVHWLREVWCSFCRAHPHPWLKQNKTYIRTYCKLMKHSELVYMLVLAPSFNIFKHSYEVRRYNAEATVSPRPFICSLLLSNTATAWILLYKGLVVLSSWTYFFLFTLLPPTAPRRQMIVLSINKVC